MSHPQADAVDTDGEVVKMIKEWASGWSAHDMAQVAALFTPDCAYEDVPTGTVNCGHEALIRFGESIFAAAPDVTYQVKHAVAVGDRGFAEWVMFGTHTGELPGFPPPNGERFRVRGASAFEVRGGRFSRCSDYWDVATFLRQLGHVD
jgi:steroid delta-isomerase-like uncharacterized protein